VAIGVKPHCGDQMNIWTRVVPAPDGGSVGSPWSSWSDVRCGGGAHLVCGRPDSWDCFCRGQGGAGRRGGGGGRGGGLHRQAAGDGPGGRVTTEVHKAALWGGAVAGSGAVVVVCFNNAFAIVQVKVLSSPSRDQRTAQLLAWDTGRYVPHKAPFPGWTGQVSTLPLDTGRQTRLRKAIHSCNAQRRVRP
jgi:hypothetical protein